MDGGHDPKLPSVFKEARKISDREPDLDPRRLFVEKKIKTKEKPNEESKIEKLKQIYIQK